MKKWLFVAVLLFGISGNLCMPKAAVPEYKYKNAVLCVEQTGVKFDSSSGYIAKKAKKWYIPAERLGKMIGFQVKLSSGKKTVTWKNQDQTYVFQSGKAYFKENNKKIEITDSIYMQNNKNLMLPEEVLSHMGFAVRHFAVLESIKKGYTSEVIVISKKQSIDTLPKKAMHSEAAYVSAANDTEQIVLVEQTSKTKANVSYHEKKSSGQWVCLYQAKGYIGKNGLGKKKEGDKKTPKGTFDLGQAFGIKKNPGTKLKYTKVNKYHYAVDDHKYPKYYNTLLDVRKIKRKSVVGEHLIDYKTVYNYAVWIGYNKEQKVGKGSSIFLHCYGKNKYTGGCVAIPEKTMIKILKKLHKGAKIVIR